VGLDFADGSEAENLEATAIGKDGELPIDEVVKAASLAQDVHARSDVEVVSVAQDDLSAHLAEFAGIDRFDAALSADGHEDGGVYSAVRGFQATETGAGGGISLEEFEHLRADSTSRGFASTRNDGFGQSAQQHELSKKLALEEAFFKIPNLEPSS
jgi:hypothetical protein